MLPRTTSLWGSVTDAGVVASSVRIESSSFTVPSPISRIAGHTTEVAKYLSQEWIDDLDRAAQASDLVRAVAPDLVLVVEHEVVGGPDGTVRYHITFDRGTARLHSGPATMPDARFSEDHATAVAVSSGAINAQSAFMTGRLRVRGDMEKLIAAHPAFTALDAALESARVRTTYA